MKLISHILSYWLLQYSQTLVVFCCSFVGNGGYVNPFFGTLYLADFKASFEQYNETGEVVESFNILFTSEEIKKYVVLKDFFFIPEYKRSYFTSNNLGSDTSESILTIFEGDLKGYEDRINIADPNGFSLCVKVNLLNNDDKVILAKGDLETENFSFILEEKDRKIRFTYYYEGGNQVLEIDIADKITLITNPITITVTGSSEASPILKMYINNNLGDEKQVGTKATLDPYNFYLTNKLSNELESYDKRIVQNILSFSGDLTEKDIYYINNILDTNF